MTHLSKPTFVRLVLLFAPLLLSQGKPEAKKSPEPSPYSFGKKSRDGIGKFYMGREISQVMGHLGAGWLERPKREQEERTDLLIKNMRLKKGDQVADVGAGSGYFSFRMAELVPDGKVFAVDISPQMLGIVRAKMASKKVTNANRFSARSRTSNCPRFDRLRAYCRCLPRVLSPPRNGSVNFQRSSRKRPIDPHRIPTGGPKRPDQVAAQNDAETSDRGNLTSRLCLEEDPRRPAPTAFHDFRKTGCRKRALQVK